MPEHTLTLLQWNVGNADVELRLPNRGWQGQFYTQASPSREEDLSDIAALILHEAPDVVTLQEMEVDLGHHLRLAELTGYRVGASGVIRREEARHTQAVLVRPGLSLVEDRLPPWQGFRAVGVRVRVNGHPNGTDLGVVSTHSCAGGRLSTQRIAQHRALAAWAGEHASRLPMVVGGDLNFDPDPRAMLRRAFRIARRIPRIQNPVTVDWNADTEALGELGRVLRDLSSGSGRTAGLPRSWGKILGPLRVPALPITWALRLERARAKLDYVFGSRHVELVEARVLRINGPRGRPHPALRPGALPWMDHDPVRVRFRLVNP